MKHPTLLITLLIMVILIGGGCFLLLSQLTKFEVKSDIPNRSFRISNILGNIYLFKQGYLNKAKSFKILYTPNIQNKRSESLYVGKDLNPIQSWYLDKKGEGKDAIFELSIYYDPQKFDDLYNLSGRFDKDLYEFICVASDKTAYDNDMCSQKARDYYNWVQKYYSGKFISLVKKLSFNLVKTAYADSCTGTIWCGEQVTTCTCSYGSGWDWECSSTGDDCGPYFGAGTCTCHTGCDFDTNNNIDCDIIISQDQCDNHSSPAQYCASYCHRPGDQEPDCSWSCTPDCSCAADTCIGDTCSNGCGGWCNGTKDCGGCTPDCGCAPATCEGDVCSDGCGGWCDGTKFCGCIPDCSCAATTCIGDTCESTCPGIFCNGTMDCSCPTVTADIKANSSDGPIQVNVNETFSRSWSSTNADGCTIDGVNVATSGSDTKTEYSAGTYNYNLNCSNSCGDSDSDTVQVRVKPFGTI